MTRNLEITWTYRGEIGNPLADFPNQSGPSEFVHRIDRSGLAMLE